jgi:hypothetical protein
MGKEILRRKSSVALIGLALVGALAVGGMASGAPTSINQFHGRCTDVKKPKFTFAVVFPIPINGKGEFTWDKKNAVNTPDGGTLSKTYRVTIDGKLVSKTEAGCKKISFDEKLIKN